MGEKIFNFYLDEEKKKELQMLSAREGKSMKNILNECIDDYIKVHKEGNPQHLIDAYTENSDFFGFPALAIDTEKKRDWIKKHKNDRVIKDLVYNCQEWNGILEENGFLV